MKRWMTVMVLFLCLTPISAFAQNNGVSIGFGFSFLTPDQDIGDVEENRSYNFEQLAYFHQWPLFWNAYLVVEPFLAYVNRPESGLEFGLSLLLRYYINTSERNRLFISAGTGGAHSTVQFEEQGTKTFFILAGGIGYQWGNFFIEDRFRHYSNSHLATPNKSVNTNIIMVGFFF